MNRGRPTRSADVDAEEFVGQEPARPVCERGTVGWEGEADIADLGTDDNGNATYIRVTLANGAPMGKPTSDEGHANGHQILCRLMMPLYFIPPRGTPCYVLFPEGRSESPGMGLVFPISGPHPLRLPNATEGDVILYNPITGGFVRLKPDGAVSMCTTDNAQTDGRTISMSLYPDVGREFVAPWITEKTGKYGHTVQHSSGAELDLGACGGFPAPLDKAGSYASLKGAVASLEGEVATSVGYDAGAANLAAVTQLGVVLTAIEAALTAISVTPAVVGSPVLTPAQALTVTTALSALATILTNIGKIV